MTYISELEPKLSSEPNMRDGEEQPGGTNLLVGASLEIGVLLLVLGVKGRDSYNYRYN